MINHSPDLSTLLNQHLTIVESLRPLLPVINNMALLMYRQLQIGGKLLWMGNGGSAADSQHLSAEMVVRYTAHRRALASIALSTDTSAITASGNDIGFNNIFARQIEALGRSNDVVIGLSTSGQSKNILKALHQAKHQGCYTIGLTGHNGSQMFACCDICLAVPSTITARIQECHILIGHMLCELLDHLIIAESSVDGK